MRLRLVTFLCALAVTAGLGLLTAQQAVQTKGGDDFHIEGVGLWQCQCPSHACPCQTNGSPKYGQCHAADFAHIAKGQYGKTRLDGLNLVLVGNLVDTKPERLFATLYLDAHATPGQREALQKMSEYLNAQNVGAPGEPPIAIKQVKAVDFAFSESADKTTYVVTIPGVLEEKAVLARDAAGNPAHTMAAMDEWSNIVHNADNVKFQYHDTEAGQAWDHSRQYANVKYFELTKQMYTKRQMLILDGDMSGKWTAKQRELIRRLDLGKH